MGILQQTGSFVKALQAAALLVSCLVFSLRPAFSQAPANDLCANASNISISNAGYGVGVFNSDTVDISNATVESAENFASAILVAGQDKKSIWFRFTLATTRSVRVTLAQPGVNIAAGDAGFTVYKSSGCLPALSSVSTKLTPIATFGNSLHPCTEPGEYLVQVSSRLTANGPLFIQLQISNAPGALYDHPTTAFSFGVLNNYSRYIDFNTECYSQEDAAEVCTSLANFQQYPKTAWLTFTTPAYFDYCYVLLSGIGPAPFTSTNRTVGYQLYEGDVSTAPVNSLPLVTACDSFRSNGPIAASKLYRCSELAYNRTYSIQLFFHSDFKEDVRVALINGGRQASESVDPVLGGVTGQTAIGSLPSSADGMVTTVASSFGCNSRHAGRACGAALADTGVVVSGQRYNLSTFSTFTLEGSTSIGFFLANTLCAPAPVMRLYKQSLTGNCNDLNPDSIVAIVPAGTTQLDCLPPGDYVMQVMGTDMVNPVRVFNYQSSLIDAEQCFSSNLGTGWSIDLSAFSRNNINHFSLADSGAVDSINTQANQLMPLMFDSIYEAKADTLGCFNTVLPAGNACTPGANKAIYREFLVADSGLLDFSTLGSFEYRLYTGDAAALSTAQQVFAYPGMLNGLVSYTNCLPGYVACGNSRVCMIPGTYTLASFGNDGQVGISDQPVFQFSAGNSRHGTPSSAQDMGSLIDTLGPLGGSINSDRDAWSCRDNAVPIGGFVPCTIAGNQCTKAIYRQFYLSTPALVTIKDLPPSFCTNDAYGSKTLFRGKATDGLAGLQPVGGVWQCFQEAASPDRCSPLDAGWYTVVSYGVGPGYTNPMRALNIDEKYSSFVGFEDQFFIKVEPTCKAPQFNRAYKASLDTNTNQPYLIQWAARPGSTITYPYTDSTYVLNTEHFNCIRDTPFASHPILACNDTVNRVAYFVFQLTQESFVQINTNGLTAAVYDRDVRVDSALFTSLVPVQPCLASAGHIQICNMQPGLYTLVIFANDESACTSVQPTIYIDRVGRSRFDFAANAYDFGIVPPDDLFHYGKTGDVNPIDPARQPSNDFIYCTTGAFTSDPTESACDPVNNNVYASGQNVYQWTQQQVSSRGINARRNLWYTFVVKEPGYVTVKLENKTVGKAIPYRFAVYKSDVDGALPFSAVLAGGQVDSTNAQGLIHVATNEALSGCSESKSELTFYRDPCASSIERYYLVVDNPNSAPIEVPGMKPNSQLEVAILIDSITLLQPRFDHYYQAGNLGMINGGGVVRGAIDNFSCATDDATDPTYAYRSTALKTLWYKFTTNVTGNVRYRMVAADTIKNAIYQLQLFRQTIPGDSTSRGLLIQNTTNSIIQDGASNTSWATTCISPGTYYVFLTGYGQLREYVYPEVVVEEELGDFCGKPVVAQLTGTSTATASLIVNCHTIGTDYGEFGTQLTCPAGASTSQYKSSWFRIDVQGSQLLDISTSLLENTNALASDIKYRLMTGNCGAMQEQSCVVDALTQNTYQCLVPGQSYFVQVFTPLLKNGQPVVGDISLQLSATQHTDTCAPLVNCLSTAAFSTVFNCATDQAVQFINQSTYGTDIRYRWDFGYNNQQSTSVSPGFVYPASSVDQTYTVKLTVTNTACGKVDSFLLPVLVPARPLVQLGADTLLCNGGTLVLNATSFAGATYLWQNNSSGPTFTVSTAGQRDYFVTVRYNNCIAKDTIRVDISPATARATAKLTLCTVGDSVRLNSARGTGVTYLWNTGATTPFIDALNAGVYWADIYYKTCVVRDSFIVSTSAAAQPLGNDTIVCFNAGPYTLNAAMQGATGYTWQDGSGAATFNVLTTGLYWVEIGVAGCLVRDTVRIAYAPAAATKDTAVSICAGESYTLPWGIVVNAAGMYVDTIRSIAGCDSLYKRLSLTVNARPALGNDVVTAICAGKALRLNQQFATAGLNLSWSQSNITVTDTLVDATGLYQLIATNLNGCADTALLQLSVLPKPLLGADQSVTKCAGDIVNLQSLYSTTNLVDAWTSTGIPVSNAAVVTLPGTYQLIATNTAGCSDTALVSLQFLAAPFAGNDTSIRICSGNSVNLLTLQSNGTLLPAWSINGVAVTNPASVSNDGLYRLVLTNAAGCADTSFVTLITDPNPVLVINAPATVCYPALVDLTAPAVTAGSVNATSFTYWQDGNTSIPLTNPAEVVTGNYFIKALNSTGCTDTGAVTATILPMIQADAGANISVCEGKQGILQGSVFNAAGSVNYLWTPDIGLGVASSAVTTVKPDRTQTYVLNVRDNYGCNFSVLDSVTVTVPPPVPAFAGNDTVVSTGLPHQLLATGGVTYHWMPESLLSNPFAANPFATLFADSVLFTVTVTDADGCVGYDTIQVKTLDGITYYVPNAFSPNADNINDVFRPIPVGIVSTTYFRVFNRYGALIFETADISRGWDGKYKGVAQSAANYVWILKGKDRSGKIIELKGNVVLVR